jgi:hypothetical protein
MVTSQATLSSSSYHYDAFARTTSTMSSHRRREPSARLRGYCESLSRHSTRKLDYQTCSDGDSRMGEHCTAYAILGEDIRGKRATCGNVPVKTA